MPINVLTKIDINKTLALPSKISRLQKMKEFFAKSKSRNGKLVIPKNLLLTNDFVVSNFGSTQIYDYDDNKDVVGSRRDFTSFSYYINGCTGELQSDICVTSNNIENDFHTENRDSILNLSRPVTPNDRVSSPMDWTSRPDTPDGLREACERIEPTKCSSDYSSINIDEGIEMDEIEKLNMLLPTAQPTVKVIDFVRRSPSLFPADLQANDSFEIANFAPDTNEKVDESKNPFKQPEKALELQIKNIFMIPLKKLKHRCLFDLPNDEYGELKRRKREQTRTSEGSVRQMKIFNPFELMKMANANCQSDDSPFLGFTNAQQNEPMTFISYKACQKLQNPIRDRSRSPIDVARKYSKDSGLDVDCNETENSSSIQNQTTIDQSTLDPTTSEIDLSAADQSCSTAKSSHDSTTTHQSPDNTITTCNNSPGDCDTDNNINISGGDSCYQSLASGDSTKADLSSFFKDIESRNATINESESNNEGDDDKCHESEERVLEMQQSAVHVRDDSYKKEREFNLNKIIFLDRQMERIFEANSSKF